MLVVRNLLGGRRRFGELRESLPGISPKTLTDRLRELEDAGLVERTMYAEIPPRVEYELTGLGRELEPVMLALADFGRLLQRGAGVASEPAASGRAATRAARR